MYLYTPKYTANYTAKEDEKLLQHKHVNVHLGVYLNAASLSTAAAYVKLFVVQQPDGLHELLNTRRQREGLRKQLHLVVKLKTATRDVTKQSHNDSCTSGKMEGKCSKYTIQISYAKQSCNVL